MKKECLFIAKNQNDICDSFTRVEHFNAFALLHTSYKNTVFFLHNRKGQAKKGPNGLACIQVSALFIPLPLPVFTSFGVLYICRVIFSHSCIRVVYVISLWCNDKWNWFKCLCKHLTRARSIYTLLMINITISNTGLRFMRNRKHFVYYQTIEL